MRVSVGADLHKGQFMVYWRACEGPLGRFERCRINDLGYRWFERQLKKLKDKGHEVRLAVESTGNTRYFKRRVEAVGVPVVAASPHRSRRTRTHRASGTTATGNDRSTGDGSQEVRANLKG